MLCDTKLELHLISSSTTP